MVTELKTEQLAVTALGGEITPALLDMAWDERKAGRLKQKDANIYTTEGFTAKMLALNSKSDQGLF